MTLDPLALLRPRSGAEDPLVQSIAPLVVPSEGRAVPLQMRITAPVVGNRLPVVVLSHGHGPSRHLSSLHGYGPLANWWAALGFCVVQPTHLDSTTLGLRESDDDEAPLFWRSRATDVVDVLDHLPIVERSVPWLSGRLDLDRVAVAGHSMGGHTASLLLGTRATDPASGDVLDLSDSRVRAGVVLSGVGRGGDALSDLARRDYGGFAQPDFSTMSPPALVVYGDADPSPHLTVAGAAWHADAFHLAPGPKSLVTLYGAGHALGGVSGYDAAETTDESPDRVALVSRMSAAYLKTQLGVDPTAWARAEEAFRTITPTVGEIEEK